MTYLDSKMTYVLNEIHYMSTDSAGGYNNAKFADRVIHDICGVERFASMVIASQNPKAIILNALRGPHGDALAKFFDDALHQSRIELVQLLEEAKKLMPYKNSNAREGYSWLRRMYKKSIRSARRLIIGSDSTNDFEGTFKALSRLNGDHSVVFDPEEYDDDEDDSPLFDDEDPVPMREFYRNLDFSPTLKGNQEFLEILRRVEMRAGRHLTDAEIVALVKKYEEDESEEEEETTDEDSLGKIMHEGSTNDLVNSIANMVLERLVNEMNPKEKPAANPNEKKFYDVDEMRRFYEEHPDGVEDTEEAPVKKQSEPEDVGDEDEEPDDYPPETVTISAPEPKAEPEKVHVTADTSTSDLIDIRNGVKEEAAEEDEVPPSSEQLAPDEESGALNEEEDEGSESSEESDEDEEEDTAMTTAIHNAWQDVDSINGIIEEMIDKQNEFDFSELSSHPSVVDLRYFLTPPKPNTEPGKYIFNFHIYINALFCIDINDGAIDNYQAFRVVLKLYIPYVKRIAEVLGIDSKKIGIVAHYYYSRETIENIFDGIFIGDGYDDSETYETLRVVNTINLYLHREFLLLKPELIHPYSMAYLVKEENLIVPIISFEEEMDTLQNVTKDLRDCFDIRFELYSAKTETGVMDFTKWLNELKIGLNDSSNHLKDACDAISEHIRDRFTKCLTNFWETVIPEKPFDGSRLFIEPDSKFTISEMTTKKSDGHSTGLEIYLTINVHVDEPEIYKEEEYMHELDEDMNSEIKYLNESIKYMLHEYSLRITGSPTFDVISDAEFITPDDEESVENEEEEEPVSVEDLRDLTSEELREGSTAEQAVDNALKDLGIELPGNLSNAFGL